MVTDVSGGQVPSYFFELAQGTSLSQPLHDQPLSLHSSHGDRDEKLLDKLKTHNR